MDPALIPDEISFASLLTAAGAGVAAALITAVVELIKRVAPTLAERVTGAAMAFILSAIVYILAGISEAVNTLDKGLTVFIAWLACASAAIGVHQVVARQAITTSSPPPPPLT